MSSTHEKLQGKFMSSPYAQSKVDVQIEKLNSAIKGLQGTNEYVKRLLDTIKNQEALIAKLKEEGRRNPEDSNFKAIVLDEIIKDFCNGYKGASMYKRVLQAWKVIYRGYPEYDLNFENRSNYKSKFKEILKQ